MRDAAVLARLIGDRRSIVVLATACLALAGWLTWPASEVVLNQQCEPVGMQALSARIYGTTFWRKQLAAVQTNRERELRWPEAIAKIDATSKEANEVARQQLEATYRMYPQGTPTAAQQAADKLRVAADEIERAEAMRLHDSMRLKQIEWLTTCERAIAQKLR